MEKPKLLDQLRDAIRIRHYSYRTEQTYVLWAKQYILFHDKRHPADMAEKEIGEFLTYLATKRKISSSTQNQALNAIIFLYKHVLGKDIGLIDGVVRAKRTLHLPEVFTKEEVKAVLDRLTGQNWLMASLLYGAGLRLMECHRLRAFSLAHSCG
ncbi:phage integrase N-terminal SAM-like domain-containing protein [Geomonas sp.]|uniref:phage integrase N-terminal SAM-like domain-containing protein n=1 Tax=Geomonas sp. TaxID=2651584 RepID=UPI002B46ED14|nr:phage integrase N-terminal SAM-like domain-containing protein [Geomonas sp.]HJV33474.1 phage integrase N-terminal SAM-like domain-containing protein [Geomonas sp.]